MNGKKYHVHNNGCGCFECHEGKNGINKNEGKRNQSKIVKDETQKKEKRKKAAQSQRDKKYLKRHKTENTSNILLKGGFRDDKK